MAWTLRNLDPDVRRLMTAEIDFDAANNRLYQSPRLTSAGTAAWPGMLKDAALSGTPESLAQALRRAGTFRTTETRNTKNGPVEARVPVTAPETLADGEFVRFYMRAVCQRAIELGHADVQVYRARDSANPRTESQALLGTRVDPTKLLDDLRASSGVDTALGLPPGPNSGLSVSL